MKNKKNKKNKQLGDMNYGKQNVEQNSKLEIPPNIIQQFNSLAIHITSKQMKQENTKKVQKNTHTPNHTNSGIANMTIPLSQRSFILKRLMSYDLSKNVKNIKQFVSLHFKNL